MQRQKGVLPPQSMPVTKQAPSVLKKVIQDIPGHPPAQTVGLHCPQIVSDTATKEGGVLSEEVTSSCDGNRKQAGSPFSCAMTVEGPKMKRQRSSKNKLP